MDVRSFGVPQDDTPFLTTSTQDSARKTDKADNTDTMDPAPRWLPNLDTVRLLLAPALVFIVAGIDRGYQTELWQHLARGRLIAAERAVVSVDRFTFTVPGRELRDNNWLSQLLYHGLHEAGGLELVQAVNALALAAAVALLVRLCRRAAGGSTGVAAAVGTCAFVGLWQTLLIRPQSFSMLLFVLLYGLLDAARNRPRLLWFVPPLMALWANLHGGFAVGLVLVGIFALAELWRRLRPSRDDTDRSRAGPFAACGLAAFSATLLNPYGPEVYLYAGNLSALGVTRGIEEWLPPSPASLVGCAFILSVLTLGALCTVSRRSVTFRDICLLVCFALPACVSVRMTVWWFLAAAPIAARLIAARLPAAGQTEPRPSPLGSAAFALLVAACALSVPWLESISPLLLTRSPHRTETDLRAVADSLPADAPSPPRVFTRMEWGNYLAWRTEGRVPVFVEGHVELYPPEVWSQFVTVNDGLPGWEAVLEGHGVRFLLLDQTYHGPLLSDVRRSGRWEERVRAGAAVLYERAADAFGNADHRPAGDF